MTDLTDDEIGFIFGGNLEHQDNEKDKDVYHCWCSNGNYGGVFYCRVNDCYYKCFEACMKQGSSVKIVSN